MSSINKNSFSSAPKKNRANRRFTMNFALIVLVVIFLFLTDTQTGSAGDPVNDSSVVQKSTKFQSSLFKDEQQGNVSEREYWGLEKDEWQTYQDLVRYEKSPHYLALEPYTILGMYAEKQGNEKGAEKYAFLTHQYQAERVDMLERFNRRVTVFNLKNLGEPFSQEKIDFYLNLKRSLAKKIKGYSQSGKKPVLAVNADCFESCKTAIRQLQDLGNGFDVYFLDKPAEDLINKWARYHKISPEDNKTRRITLNYASEGSLLSEFKDEAPVAFSDSTLVQRLDL